MGWVGFLKVLGVEKEVQLGVDIRGALNVLEPGLLGRVVGTVKGVVFKGAKLSMGLLDCGNLGVRSDKGLGIVG